MHPTGSNGSIHRFAGFLAVVAVLLPAGAGASEAASDPHQVEALEITILSTMLTQTVAHLGRKNAVVGAIGASFTLEGGVNPLSLAH